MPQLGWKVLIWKNKFDYYYFEFRLDKKNEYQLSKKYKKMIRASKTLLKKQQRKTKRTSKK